MSTSISTSGSSRSIAEKPQSQGERSLETPDYEHEHACSTRCAAAEPQSRRRRPYGDACCEYEHLGLAALSGRRAALSPKAFLEKRLIRE